MKPRKRTVAQVLQIRSRGRWRTVGVRRLPVTLSGRFRGSFVPATRRVYRYYVASRADSRNARGASRRYRLRVSRTRGGGVEAP
jgi:hypothetical protein